MGSSGPAITPVIAHLLGHGDSPFLWVDLANQH